MTDETDSTRQEQRAAPPGALGAERSGEREPADSAKPSLYGQPPETPEPLAAWAPVPFQQLDMLEHLIAALDWVGMDQSHVTVALGLAERLRLKAGEWAQELERLDRD